MFLQAKKTYKYKRNKTAAGKSRRLFYCVYTYHMENPKMSWQQYQTVRDTAAGVQPLSRSRSTSASSGVT